MNGVVFSSTFRAPRPSAPHWASYSARINLAISALTDGTVLTSVSTEIALVTSKDNI